MYLDLNSCQHLISVHIQFQEYEQQNRKSPKGRSPVRKEWQGNTNYREKSNSHTNVNGKMEKENRRHGVAVYFNKLTFLSSG